MPFRVRKVKGGYKVTSPSGSKSHKPMTKARAEAQRRAIAASYYGKSSKGKGKRKKKS